MTERAASNVPRIPRRRGLLAGVVALCLVVLGVAEGVVENVGLGSPYPGLLAALLPARCTSGS